jgi:hypothetical protein
MSMLLKYRRRGRRTNQVHCGLKPDGSQLAEVEVLDRLSALPLFLECLALCLP